MKEVVVGVILRTNDEQKKEVLLVSSKRDYGEFTGFFYPPGGKVELGETEEEALKREIKEELSVEVFPKRRIDTTPGDVSDQKTSWWLCKISDLNCTIKSSELQEMQWIPLEAIEKRKDIWPATKKFFRKHISELC